MTLCPRDKAGPSFAYASRAGAVALSLLERGKAIATELWTEKRPDAAASISWLFNAAERVGDDGSPLVAVEQDCVQILPDLVAELDTATSAMLALPAPLQLALDLRPQGRIDQDDFRLDIRWVRPGGQAARVAIDGALIRYDGGERRIPQPLWSLYKAVLPLSVARPAEERFRLLAELRQAWPETEPGMARADAYLSNLRVHFASALSIKIRTLTPERTDFDPLLFAATDLSDAQSEQRAVDEDLDNVLTPAAQRLFAEDRFRRERDVRPVYVLKDGEYVFIDPALRPALGQIRRLQDAPDAERRAFVLNPRRVLRERLGDDASSGSSLESLFVETEQFSARVAGVDVWRAPVLPWLQPSHKNQWLPERFGLRVGQDYYEVAPKDASALLERLEQASARGEATAPVGDILYPASENAPAPERIGVDERTLESARALADIARAAAVSTEPEAAPNAEAWDAALGGKLFLLVKENFEEVDYASAEGAAPVRLEPPTLARLATALKPHQGQGLAWLASAFASRRPGVLLADDMGLGKTLQAIAFMLWVQEEAENNNSGVGPFLIVAPTGLLANWRAEIDKHLRGHRLGKVVCAFGSELKWLREESGLSARDIETGRASLRAAAWTDAGVVLTTYETLRDYHFSFARTKFAAIVYDEIQKLKNPASQVTRAAKALNASFVLGMTGTPVENRLQDLWSIMDVITPGLLGASRDFERRFRAEDVAALGALKSLLTHDSDHPAVMLRRMKSESLDGLPQKYVHPISVEMPPAQAQAYESIVYRAAAARSGGTLGKGGMLEILAALRGVSLHPRDPRHTNLDDFEAYAAESARLACTLDLLGQIEAKGEKALVFVEDLAMQDLLAELLHRQFKLKRRPFKINGGVPGLKRQLMVDEFQAGAAGFDVMVLSPKAGGVGLTVTAANHVIHLSRWWNPAVEDQATDRVYRIGQSRDVHVYLPIAVHPDPALRQSSFDLRLDALIARKRKLTSDLLVPPDSSQTDLSDLFGEVAAPGQEPPALTPALPGAPQTNEASPAAPMRGDGAQERPILRVAQPARSARHWRCNAGAERPTRELLACFADQRVAKVLIRDPYALGRDFTRNAQIRFLAELAGVARSLESVVVEYAPEIEADMSEGEQRRRFGETFARTFGTSPPLMNLVRRRRRAGDDFHDRSVEITTRSAADALQTHTIMIGRGLEALYDQRKECTAVYFPPSLPA
ncbi:MAG: DEAD/DEAH box helicase [Hyphomonadaceae bacterium]